MNQLRRLCQIGNDFFLVFVCLFLLPLIVSCSGRDYDPRKDPSQVQAQWFSELIEREMIHYFFDPSPAVDFSNFELSYVIKIPQGARHSYQLDLASGQLVRNFDYCPQDDVRKRPSTIDRPMMNIGIVPRLIDQSGQAQSIIVFGDHQKMESFRADRPAVHRARVIGGIIEQYCDKSDCVGPDEWVSRQVLVAVVPYDRRYRNVRSIEELKEKVEWFDVIAFLENRKGRSGQGAHARAAYYVHGSIAAAQAMQMAFEKGHYFRFAQMQNLKSSCSTLYEFMAERLREIKFQAAPSGNGEALSSDDPQLAQWLASPYFYQFFKALAIEYGSSFRTCMRYTLAVDWRKDSELHWQFAYIQAFFALERLGLFYHCRQRRWLENISYSDGQMRYDRDAILRECSPTELDDAFERAVEKLARLDSIERPHFRYVRYDMGSGGSNQEVFSWVKHTGKSFVCRRSKSRPMVSDFPQELRWIRSDSDSSESLIISR